MARWPRAGAIASVGSRGDSYDNAMAEAFNSLFKAELVRNKGPWRSIDDLEIAVAEYIDWFKSPPSSRRDRPCPAGVRMASSRWVEGAPGRSY